VYPPQEERMSRKKKNKSKRIVVVSDMHCGHLVGLTPPDYQQPFTKSRNTWCDKVAELERECYNWYEKTIDALKPVDIVIANADLIDGRGERSGSTELITADRYRQTQMALDALKYIEAKNYVMTYGTPYHTGAQEDFEDIICDGLNKLPGVTAKIGSHEWIDVNGCIFDCKHHLGSSQVPHGRFTALARDTLWNNLWSLHDEQPTADVIIRSHVHYHGYCGENDWLALTTPALQAMGTKFGSRKCSGRVNFGLVHFDVDSDGGYTWQPHIANIKRQKAQAIKL
jgi:hypothetical protein